MKPSAAWATLVGKGRIFTAPGAHDALDARIIARAGHRAVYLGGNALALGLGKGQPFISLTETAEITRRVAAAVSVPLIVDIGAGFGAASHVDLAVREMEAAGAAAVHIDDQPYPKSPDYHRGKGDLAAPDAILGKLRVACAARSEDGMAIIARTDALRVTGSIDETIARVRAYAETGIDGLIILDLGVAQAAEVRAAVPGLPLVWIGGVHPPVPSVEALEAAGFAGALYPFNGLAEIMTRLAELWGSLSETGLVSQAEDRLQQARGDALVLADMQRLWAVEDGAGSDD